MVPGMNLLALALTVIGSTPVNYFAFVSRDLNAGGVYVTTYAAFVTYKTGSVQAVDRAQYQYLGLDFEKTYISWFVPNLDAVDLARDVSGDVIEVNGGRWQLKGGTDWFKMDGWKSLIAVYTGPATGALTNA